MKERKRKKKLKTKVKPAVNTTNADQLHQSQCQRSPETCLVWFIYDCFIALTSFYCCNHDNGSPLSLKGNYASLVAVLVLYVINKN